MRIIYTHTTLCLTNHCLGILHVRPTGKSATTTYIAPAEEDLEPVPSSTQQRSGCEDRDCGHCDDAEVFSDYDTEFIESAQNNYATYYFQDSDGEESPLIPSSREDRSSTSGAQLSSAGSSSKHAQSRGGGSQKAKARSSSFGLIDADERL